MTEQKRQIESLILVAIGKLFNEQSSFLIGELKFKTKMDFNNAVRAVNTFVAGIEQRLNETENDFLQQLTDAMHNGLSEMRDDLEKQAEEKSKTETEK